MNTDLLASGVTNALEEVAEAAGEDVSVQGAADAVIDALVSAIESEGGGFTFPNIDPITGEIVQTNLNGDIIDATPGRKVDLGWQITV